ITAVNLVDLGASTHQMDFDQHFVPLSFTAGSGSLSVQMPSTAAYAPPGNYMLFFINSDGVPSVASMISLSSSQDEQNAISSTLATPGSVSATVLSSRTARVVWGVPAIGSSAIKSYTVTPFSDGRALTPVRVSGSPAPTSATVGGLEPGKSYTFKVTATTSRGTGHASRPSKPVIPNARPKPAFVQEMSAYADDTQDLVLKPTSTLTPGARMVVEISIWGHGARAAGVTDSVGDRYTELLSRIASDGTQLSVWTAPVDHGASTPARITVSPTSTADIGAVAVEYSGLSTAPGLRAVDQMAVASGTTHRAAVIGSGETLATTARDELAVGLYADSGFGDVVDAGRGYRQRANISRTRTMMEQLVEDRIVSTTSKPEATVRTGPSTPWLMATVVFATSASSAHSGAGALLTYSTSSSKTASTSATTATSTSATTATPGSATTTASTSATTATPGSSTESASTTGSATATSSRVFSSLRLVPPLSSRRRPHAVAGAISEFLGLTNGFLPLYYCLVHVAKL
ncbi:MAG: galactose oxidase-like domain-containing protein, partial [Solirubrobacteraceae bacterium]